jgi:hypothetical protein
MHSFLNQNRRRHVHVSSVEHLKATWPSFSGAFFLCIFKDCIKPLLFPCGSSLFSSLNYFFISLRMTKLSSPSHVSRDSKTSPLSYHDFSPDPLNCDYCDCPKRSPGISYTTNFWSNMPCPLVQRFLKITTYRIYPARRAHFGFLMQPLPAASRMKKISVACSRPEVSQGTLYINTSTLHLYSYTSYPFS